MSDGGGSIYFFFFFLTKQHEETYSFFKQYNRIGRCTSSIKHNERCHKTTRVSWGLNDEYEHENIVVIINDDNYDNDVNLNFPDKCTSGNASGGDIYIAVDLCESHWQCCMHK